MFPGALCHVADWELSTVHTIVFFFPPDMEGHKVGSWPNIV